MKLKRRAASTSPPETHTQEERLAQIRYLALQRWGRHIALFAQGQERQARAIAARAVADIEAQSGPFPPFDREAMIAALTVREIAHLVACVGVIIKDAETVAAASPSLAAALTNTKPEVHHG